MESRTEKDRKAVRYEGNDEGESHRQKKCALGDERKEVFESALSPTTRQYELRL